MKIYLKEKIGNPELFTGRKKELTHLLTWVERIKKEISQSRSLLSRRKTGKTALLQRLYNIVFDKNDGVIPFYYEVPEGEQWSVDFCKDFFLNFVFQYMAFKSRNPEYIELAKKNSFELAAEAARKEHQEHLVSWVDSIQVLVDEERVDNLWHAVREAPMSIAQHYDERVLQIIDEFQYLNHYIYWDKAKTRQATTFARGYSRTAEYKNAPLLVSGSWVGWLMSEINPMVGRFRNTFLENMPEDEAVELVFKYAATEDVPVTEESAYLIAKFSEGNPFYISALFRSVCPEKDLTTKEGIQKTLEYETLHPGGEIRKTWMEYIQYAFNKVNDRQAKRIVLYLSKNSDREINRREIRQTLTVDMPDEELEKKMTALVKADIIEQGRSLFYYKGVSDNVFDKVFRGLLADEIEDFDPKEITNEYKALFDDLQAKYRRLSGEYNYYKGAFAEFLIINHLKFRAFRHNERFKAMIHNLPEDFQFVEYETVWSYSASPVHKRDLKIDLFAKAAPDQYSIIGEVKNRETVKFSKEEAEAFAGKAKILRELEYIGKAVMFVFSKCGFTEDCLEYFRQNSIAWSEDNQWLDEGHTQRDSE